MHAQQPSQNRNMKEKEVLAVMAHPGSGELCAHGPLNEGQGSCVHIGQLMRVRGVVCTWATY